MLIDRRRSDERGRTDIDWLKSSHTFSFGEYFSRENMGFRSLRVINEDVIAPGMGFGEHAHHDMEIITIVLSGELQHRDNLGSSEVLRPGEVQVMSAGIGVVHSEFNPSNELPVHLLQIWIEPNEEGVTPSYERRAFEFRLNGFQRVVGPDTQFEDDAIFIHADAHAFLAEIESQQTAVYELRKGRYAWLHVAEGAVEIDGGLVSAGDSLSYVGSERIRVKGAREKSKVILFDLA